MVIEVRKQQRNQHDRVFSVAVSKSRCAQAYLHVAQRAHEAVQPGARLLLQLPPLDALWAAGQVASMVREKAGRMASV